MIKCDFRMVAADDGKSIRIKIYLFDLRQQKKKEETSLRMACNSMLLRDFDKQKRN